MAARTANTIANRVRPTAASAAVAAAKTATSITTRTAGRHFDGRVTLRAEDAPDDGNEKDAANGQEQFRCGRVAGSPTPVSDRCERAELEDEAEAVVGRLHWFVTVRPCLTNRKNRPIGPSTRARR
jgi:hypothetical protein